METKQNLGGSGNEDAIVQEVESLNGFYKSLTFPQGIPGKVRDKKVTLNPLAEEASEKTKLEGLSAKVFNDRYSLKSGDGRQLEHSPEEMWHRVAGNIAGAERDGDKRKQWQEKFYWALEGFKFVPAGRILTG